MPAKINGLAKKGQIEISFDADIVIFDPDYEGTISVANNLEGVDYCPFVRLFTKRESGNSVPSWQKNRA